MAISCGMMHAQHRFSGIFTGYDEHDVFKLLLSRLICYTLSIFVHYFGAKHYNFGKGYFCKTTSTLSDDTNFCIKKKQNTHWKTSYRNLWLKQKYFCFRAC